MNLLKYALNFKPHFTGYQTIQNGVLGPVGINRFHFDDIFCFGGIRSQDLLARISSDRALELLA